MTNRKQLDDLLDLLITYSSDKMQGLGYEGSKVVRLTYKIMLQAGVDLNSCFGLLVNEADDYLKSDQFKKHCEICCIDPALMTHILVNMDDMLETIDEYDQPFDWFLQ